MAGDGDQLRIQDAPWEMASKSKRAAKAREYVFEQIASIRDDSLREQVQDMFRDMESRPALVASRSPWSESEEEWVDKLRLPLAYDPTWAGPGASFSSHHGYPGGWAIHTALNLNAMTHMARQVRDLKGVEVDLDAMIAGMALHDWAKLKLLRWNEDHTLDAGEGYGHHPIVIAEAIVRGFPPRVVHLLAGVHSGWWLKPDSVEKVIRTSAEWIGVDPDSTGYLLATGRHTVESWIMRQAEVTWYGVTRETVQRVRDVIGAWCEDRDIPHAIERVQNALFSTWDELQINQSIALHDIEYVFRELDKWYETVNADN